MQVYLTEREVLALISSATEWCSMMSDGGRRVVPGGGGKA